MLDTMDNGAAGALNGLGDLCFIDGNMDPYLYINILKFNLGKSWEIWSLLVNNFSPMISTPKHIALHTRYWLLCNTPHWMQTLLHSPIINQTENLWHNLEEEVRNHNISSKNDLKKPLEEEWMKITREKNIKTSQITHKRLKETIKSKGGSTQY